MHFEDRKGPNLVLRVDLGGSGKKDFVKEKDEWKGWKNGKVKRMGKI